jgi:hypothetical protein
MHPASVKNITPGFEHFHPLNILLYLDLARLFRAQFFLLDQNLADEVGRKFRHNDTVCIRIL